MKEEIKEKLKKECPGADLSNGTRNNTVISRLSPLIDSAGEYTIMFTYIYSTGILWKITIN